MGQENEVKAAVSQIPVDNIVEQASQSTAPKEGGSNLWAMLRRQKAQIGQIELVLSALKRDVARIDRKQYREAKDEPPSSLPNAPNSGYKFPDGLFN